MKSDDLSCVMADTPHSTILIVNQKLDPDECSVSPSPGVNQRTEAGASCAGIQMALPMKPGSKMEF